jgi:hypothetical protein
MSQSWTFANAHSWYPDLPIDPPTTDYDRYESRWEQWLDDNYDKETNTIFGLSCKDQDIDDVLYDKFWDKFMDEVIYAQYD